MKKTAVIFVCSAFMLLSSLSVCADGGTFFQPDTTETAVTAETVNVQQMLEDMSARSVSVIETSTGKCLFSKNGNEKRSISHLAKLMTILIAEENINSGKLSADDTVTVSQHANSMQGSQIWLDKGEKIKVSELLKSVTVGNANDACVALAEKISGSEDIFTEEMNIRAKELLMNDTYFADCTGISEKTVSTSEDIAKLCCELLKYDGLKKYFTTWMDNVRNGKAELVNQNRLVRTYNGISGMKACGSEKSGNCTAVTAKRGNLSVCAVLLGCETSEKRDAEAKKLLDMSFESFELYTPEIPTDFLEDIKVRNGEQNYVKTVLDGKNGAVIPKGSSSNVKICTEREECLTAPVEKGENVGKLTCSLDDTVILDADLKTDGNVKKMNMKFALKKLIYNLLSF